MFNELSKRKSIDWGIDTTDFGWINLDEWVEKGYADHFVVRGVFINPHGKITKKDIGEVPYVITDGTIIRLPVWCVKMVNMLLDDQTLVQGIKDGKCGAKIMQYEDQFGKTRNKIELYDIE